MTTIREHRAEAWRNMKAALTTGRILMPNGKLSSRLYSTVAPKIDLRPGGIAYVESYADFDDMAMRQVEGRQRDIAYWGLDLAADETTP